MSDDLIEEAKSWIKDHKPSSKIIPEKAHAFFGSPSGMKALQECPGKLAMCKGLDPIPQSEYAIEGTIFHEWMEIYLFPALNNKRYSIKPVTPYPDMHVHIKVGVERALDYWKKFQAKHTDCKFYVEQKVVLDKRMDIWGTADLVFEGKNIKGKTDLLILDWKYGQGVLINAEENLQAITYALATRKTLNIPFAKIGNILIVVAQLRLENGWSEWVLKGSAIDFWCNKIFRIVEEGKKLYDNSYGYDWYLDQYLKAGPHCRFCPAAYYGKCSKPTELKDNELILTATEYPIEERIQQLTLDQQVELFLRKSTIEDGLNAIAQNLNRLMSAGITHPKLKLIEKRGHRKWRYSEETMIERLKKAGIKKPFAQPKLMGITEAESLIGKEKLAKLIVKGKGKTEVVRSGDSREEIEVDEPEEFLDA